MRTRHLILMITVLVSLQVVIQAQYTYKSLSSTTLETAQIEIPDPQDTIDSIVVTSSDPKGRGTNNDYVERNIQVKTFYVNVGLGMGENEFVFNLFKNRKFVTAFTVTILRVAPDKSSNSGKANSLQTRPAYSNSAQVLVPTITEESTSTRAVSLNKIAYFGPTRSDQTGSDQVDSGRKALELSSPQPLSPKDDSFVRGSISPVLVVANVSNDKKARDAEDESVPFNPNLRLLFGFEQVGASSAATKGHPFVDLVLNIPVGQLGVKYTSNGRTPTRRYFKNAFWTNLKLTSTPNQALPDLGGTTEAAITGFFGSNQSSRVNDLVQAFEMKIGWESSLSSNFGIIGGIGATSPLTSEKTAVAYKIPRLANGEVHPEFKRIFGPTQDFDGIENLILTSGDRDRFMRNWFVGGRLRYQLIPERMNDVYPAVFDLTVGQDEVLTNKLIGAVLKFDSFVPIPVKGLNFLYFGASFSSRLTRRVNTTTFPFFLEPASNINIFSSGNFVRNIRDVRELNSDRDNFSFRFGVDLLQLLNKKDRVEEPERQPKRRVY